MSVRRLTSTSIAMAVVALLLAVLTPGLRETADGLLHAQRTVDREGADALLLSAAGLAAWAVWAWGVLGLALTAASVIPGVVGRTAGGLLRVLLPAGARRSAALALGLGLGIAAPVVVGGPADGLRMDLAVATASGTVPDWPSADGDDVPDWPSAESAGSHVVVRGDCLWDIAGGRLVGSGTPPTDTEIAAAVQAWWSANEQVIGPDPDLILPGQVLRAPPS